MQVSRTDHAKNDASKLVGTLESRGRNNSLAVTQQTAGSPGRGTQTSLFPAPSLLHHHPSAHTSWPVSPSFVPFCRLLGLTHSKAKSLKEEQLSENPAAPK